MRLILEVDGTLWRHDRDVKDQNIVMLLTFREGRVIWAETEAKAFSSTNMTIEK